jgi:two-component system chemotaxis response regulator CheY
MPSEDLMNAPYALQGGQRDRHALIVDHDPSTGELLRDVLSSVGIGNIATVGRAEAARRLPKDKFDVILVDLSESPVEVIELTRKTRLSGVNRMTPILMISDQRPGALALSFEAGATFFLHKPIEKARLTSLLKASGGAVEHERRRFRRITLQCKINVRLGNTEMDGETIDVSLGGTLVKADQAFPRGSFVQIRLFLAPEPHPLVGFGFVMRTPGGDHMGIQLNSLPARETVRLQEYLLQSVAV